MYSKRLEEIDPDSKNNQHFLHSTRFKDHLLQLDSDLREDCAGRSHPTLISHKFAQAEAINKEYKMQKDDPNIHYIKASLLLHKLIINYKIKPFTGSFTPGCLTDDVPEQLLDFV